jgi:hypothetical protein
VLVVGIRVEIEEQDLFALLRADVGDDLPARVEQRLVTSQPVTT